MARSRPRRAEIACTHLASALASTRAHAPHLYQLIKNEEWLRIFCTYKQERAILHWATKHGEQRPVKIELEEGDEKQSFITLQLNVALRSHSNSRARRARVFFPGIFTFLTRAQEKDYTL